MALAPSTAQSAPTCSSARTATTRCVVWGGKDLLCGARGNDELTGGAGPDRLEGSAGTDAATDFDAAQEDNRVGIP